MYNQINATVGSVTNNVLLVEYNDFSEYTLLDQDGGFDRHFLNERKFDGNSTQDKVMVRGPIQRYGALNKNKRIYPERVLKNAVEKYKELIEKRGALGELDHPESGVLSLKSSSHLIENVWWKGNELWADIEILNTPSAEILRRLLEREVRLGISSRGVGSVKAVRSESHGGVIYEVQDDYELICFDFVSNPSTHDAYVKPVSEGIMESAAMNMDVVDNNVKLDLLLRNILDDLEKLNF